MFMMILFCIVLSKYQSFSKDKREKQEEPIAPIALMEGLTNLTFLHERKRGHELYMAAFCRLVSKPTVSSKVYRTFVSVSRRSPGRKDWNGMGLLVTKDEL